MKRVLPLGASVCFDVGFVHEDGRMSPAQVAQLGRIVALVRGKPDAETAARHEREMKVIDALKDVELAYGRGCEHPLSLEDRDTDDAEIRAALDKDGAEECVIEYLTSPNPTPKQVFEIIGSGEEASHRVTETQRGEGLCAAQCMKLRSVWLSRPSAVSLRSAVPLRRMDSASPLTFVITRPLLPCFISAASPQGDFMGVWGLRPQLKNFAFFVFFAADKTCRGSELGLRDAKLWSGSENPNHRS